MTFHLYESQHLSFQIKWQTAYFLSETDKKYLGRKLVLGTEISFFLFLFPSRFVFFFNFFKWQIVCLPNIFSFFISLLFFGLYRYTIVSIVKKKNCSFRCILSYFYTFMFNSLFYLGVDYSVIQTQKFHFKNIIMFRDNPIIFSSKITFSDISYNTVLCI